MTHQIPSTPEPAKDLPILLAPGWGESPRVLAPLARELECRGRSTVRVRHYRWRSWRRERGGDCPPEQLRKARRILAELDSRGIERCDALAHSEAGVNVLAAARLAPHRFRSIILVNSAGHLLEDRFLPLACRLTLKSLANIADGLRHPHMRRAVLSSTLAGCLYFSANPVRAVREGKCLARINTAAWIRELRGKGIRIVVLHGADDRVFPVELVQKATLSDAVDGVIITDGGHDNIVLEPSRYAPVIDSLLRTLARKPAAP